MFRRAGKRMLLETTIHLVRKGEEVKLYNHLRLQRYQDTALIQTIIEQMIPNRLHVEEWIIKKRYQGKNTDFRVLTINQQAVFIQPRHSLHPITNLHLGNKKGSLEQLEREWGERIIENIKMVAHQTAKQLPKLFYAGIDIAVDKEGNPYVLEVNPFGDFLKEIFVDNKNTYELELQYWQQNLRPHNKHQSSQA